jgi:hypothetical protein
MKKVILVLLIFSVFHVGYGQIENKLVISKVISDYKPANVNIKPNFKVGVFQLGMKYAKIQSLDLYNTENQITCTTNVDDKKAWNYGAKVIWTQKVCCIFERNNTIYRITVNGNFPTPSGLKNGNSLNDLKKLYGLSKKKYICKGATVYEYKQNNYFMDVFVRNNKVTLWSVSLYNYTRW